MLNLVNVDTKAPDARMHPSVAPHFNKLREIVREGSGRDFLAKCGDILRDPHFTSGKDGVADRSWHKTGRAFDYDQTSPYLVLVSVPGKANSISARISFVPIKPGNKVK